MIDPLGDRMKEYERVEGGRKFMPMLPTFARLDGKCFSKFTKGLDRPCDVRFVDLMMETMVHLTDVTGAKLGYTQSDEITLMWYSDNYQSQIFHDGKVHKMVSVLTSMATWYFNFHLIQHIPEKAESQCYFDCRAWQVPNFQEAANVFLWRQADCTRNSILGLAQCHMSHREMQGKDCHELVKVLREKGVEWEEQPQYHRLGIFAKRTVVERKFTAEEIEKLPEKHEARRNPDLMVMRTSVDVVDIPDLRSCKDKPKVLFGVEC